MRLKTRFVTALSAVLIGFCCTVAATNWVSQSSAIRTRLRSKAVALASLMAEALTNPLAKSELGEVRRTAASARSQGGVVHVYVFDPDGQILSDGTSENAQRFKILEDPISRQAVAARGLLTQFSEDFLDVSAPVKLGEERIGGVRIGFDLTEMHEELASVRNRTVGTGVLFLLAGLGVAGWLMRSITRPIGQLAKMTHAVSAGDFSARVRLPGKDELTELAASFNAMTAGLQSVTVSRDYVDSVLLSIADCLLVLDSKGFVETVNAATCALLDVEEDEIVGRPARSFFVERLDREVLRPLLTDKQVAGVELYVHNANGTQIPVAVSGSVLETGGEKLHGYVLIARDIRERRHTQDALGELVSEVAVAATQAETRARTVRDAVAGTATISETGRTEVQRAVEAMERVADRVQRTTDSLSRLNESAEGIGLAVHELTSLAKRTDLLALNAAIQAAQAGSTAAGFATVATEVGELAANAQTFTNSISKVLVQIENEVRVARDTNSEVKDALEEASSVGVTTRETIAALAGALDEARAATSEIASFAGQPAEGLARIREAIAGL